MILGGSGNRISLALDSDGNPHISSAGGGYLHYSYWTGSDWSSRDIDRGVVWENSLALDTQGRPHISYYITGRGGDYDLKYAHWTGTAWLFETVDSYSYVGQGNSIALDSHGVPHISYQGIARTPTGERGALQFASRTSSGWEIETVDLVWLSYTSLVIDPNDDPHISYDPGSVLRYAEAVSPRHVYLPMLRR